MLIFNSIIYALWYILPAYLANASAPYLGGGTPIDLGSFLSDGNRILGDGKTFKGFIGSILVGTSVSIIQYLFGPNFGVNVFLLAFLLSLGAMMGDIVASFFKRRFGVERGGEFPLLDQLDFLFGSIIIGMAIYTPSFTMVIILVILTPIIHKISNYIAYILGIKDVPW